MQDHVVSSHRAKLVTIASSWFIFLKPHYISALTVFCYLFSLLKSAAQDPEDSSLFRLKGNSKSSLDNLPDSLPSGVGAVCFYRLRRCWQFV